MSVEPFKVNIIVMVYRLNGLRRFDILYLQEVGSIIGKKGDIVKRFREEVGTWPGVGWFITLL